MESAPVSMTVTWCVPAREAQSVTTALQALMMHTRAQPGCAGCSLSTEMGPEVVIHYLERWKSETDLRHQVRSNRFTTLAELLEHAAKDPVVEFALAEGTRGLDYASEIRRSSRQR